LFILQRNNAEVIANSILNLREKKLINAPEEDPHISSELRNQGVELMDEGAGQRVGSEGVGPDLEGEGIQSEGSEGEGPDSEEPAGKEAEGDIKS
jgi:hypothetical protein